jgi:hypothetical protein
MEARVSDRGSPHPDWAVFPALEPGRTVAPERYHPHYRPPLGSADGSNAASSDWSV